MNELWKLHGRLDLFFYAKAKKSGSKNTYCGGVVQPLSPVWLFVTPWTIAHQVPLTSTVSRSLLKFTSTESVILSNSSSSAVPLVLPSIFSSIRVFSNELTFHIKWPKYWSFSFSNSPSNEYLGLISFRIDWFDFLAVQGTPRHHNLKASVLQCSAYFMVQLSHSYLTTGKTIVLTIQTLVGKVIISAFS